MNNTTWLKIFRFIGIVSFVTVSILIVYFIYVHKYEEVVRLLVPFGVLISAFIASYSVMASIDNTNKLEEEIKTQKLHSRLDMSFYMLDKNKENIRLLEEHTKINNPLIFKHSILDVLDVSLKNIEKLENQITVSPTTISRIESYIFGMKFILEELPKERGIKLTKEFNELLKNFKDVTENTIEILIEEHSSSSKNQEVGK